MRRAVFSTSVRSEVLRRFVPAPARNATKSWYLLTNQLTQKQKAKEFGGQEFY